MKNVISIPKHLQNLQDINPVMVNGLESTSDLSGFLGGLRVFISLIVLSHPGCPGTMIMALRDF